MFSNVTQYTHATDLFQNWNHDHKTTEYAARRAHVNALQRYVSEITIFNFS